METGILSFQKQTKTRQFLFTFNWIFSPVIEVAKVVVSIYAILKVNAVHSMTCARTLFVSIAMIVIVLDIKVNPIGP